jgi:hypothetical protein
MRARSHRPSTALRCCSARAAFCARSQASGRARLRSADAAAHSNSARSAYGSLRCGAAAMAAS